MTLLEDDDGAPYPEIVQRLHRVAHHAWHLLDDGGEVADDPHSVEVTKHQADRLSDALDDLEASGWQPHPDDAVQPNDRGSARPDWDAYFLDIATAVAARAECQRRQVGAVIVDTHRRIIATGYNGTPPGDARSCLRGDCPRVEQGGDHSAGGYENCINLHAEQNAIANATRDLQGGTIYITAKPCPMCAKLCQAAGLGMRWLGV